MEDICVKDDASFMQNGQQKKDPDVIDYSKYQ